MPGTARAGQPPPVTDKNPAVSYRVDGNQGTVRCPAVAHPPWRGGETEKITSSLNRWHRHGRPGRSPAWKAWHRWKRDICSPLIYSQPSRKGPPCQREQRRKLKTWTPGLGSRSPSRNAATPADIVNPPATARRDHRLQCRWRRRHQQHEPAKATVSVPHAATP